MMKKLGKSRNNVKSVKPMKKLANKHALGRANEDTNHKHMGNSTNRRKLFMCPWVNSIYSSGMIG